MAKATKDIDLTTFGGRVKARRVKLGMTLTQLADKMDVEPSTVRKWEEGQIKNLRTDKLQKLASALQIDISYLMGWDTDTRPDPVDVEERLAMLNEMKRQLQSGIDFSPNATGRTGPASYFSYPDQLSEISSRNHELTEENLRLQNEVLALKADLQQLRSAPRGSQNALETIFSNFSKDVQRNLISYAIDNIDELTKE